jgi:hypothetical protein
MGMVCGRDVILNLGGEEEMSMRGLRGSRIKKKAEDVLGTQSRADVYTRIEMMMTSRLRLEKGTSVLGVLRGRAEDRRME